MAGEDKTLASAKSYPMQRIGWREGPRCVSWPVVWPPWGRRNNAVALVTGIAW
jgi:hypothetical protein